ncbi:MAG: hypothetical protein JWM10_141 [Myxococcaceae bacterium]|nr:hypothetical protein [Myxococcaceae bacterium]
MNPSNDDPAIETEDGHRLTPLRRFGNPGFKAGAHLLRLLGWDPSGAILHLQPTLESAAPRVESWNVRTGERLPPTFLDSRAPVAGLAIDAACSPITALRKGWSEVTEVWDLRAGQLLATLPFGPTLGDFAASSDGRLAVHCYFRVDVYALPGGDVVGSWSGERPFAVSPDGALIVSRTSSHVPDKLGPLRVSRPDGTAVAPMAPAGLGRASAVAFSHDGRRVIAGLDDGEVACWEVATGERLWRVRPHGGGAPRAIVAVACSAAGESFFTLDSGDRLCAISATGAVRWCAPSGRPARRPSDWGRLLPSPDGTSLAVHTLRESPRIVDAATGAERTPIEGHRDGITALAVSPDGRFAASGDRDGEVRVYDLARDDTLWTLEVDGEVRGVEFTRDGRSLRTAGSDGYVRRWSLATGFEEAQWRRQVRSATTLGLVGARDGARLLVISDGRLQLWSDQTATPVQWSQWIKDVRRFEAAFSDAESRVVVAACGNTKVDRDEWSFVTLDAPTGRQISAREAVPGHLMGLRPTDDGPLSFGLAGDRLVVREAFGARREVAVREKSAAIWEFEVSADGRWMALADRDDVEVWSLAPTARCAARVRPVDGLDSVARLALSADGGVLVVGTSCGVVAVYARTAVA